MSNICSICVSPVHETAPTGEVQVFSGFTIDGFPDNLCLYSDTGHSLTEYDIWSLQYAVGKIHEFETL